MRRKISRIALSLWLGSAVIATASASAVTYSFTGEVPTNSGPMPGSFVLTVPDFITNTPTQFRGTDFASCSAPGTGDCVAQFSIGPSPISGLANDIGFGNDICCFIYFFPDKAFVTPGTYTADPFHSAGTATLTVAVNSVPEPGTLGLASGALLMAGILLCRRRRASPKSELAPRREDRL